MVTTFLLPRNLKPMIPLPNRRRQPKVQQVRYPPFTTIAVFLRPEVSLDENIVTALLRLGLGLAAMVADDFVKHADTTFHFPNSTNHPRPNAWQLYDTARSLNTPNPNLG